MEQPPKLRSTSATQRDLAILFQQFREADPQRRQEILRSLERNFNSEIQVFRKQMLDYLESVARQQNA